MVESIRRLFIKIEQEKVWSNADLPADVRVPEHFLFGLEKLFASEKWGYENQDLWVDKVKKRILLGQEEILSVSIENLKMTFTYGPFLEEHIAGDVEFKKLFQEKQDQLDRSSKGDGKGKKGSSR